MLAHGSRGLQHLDWEVLPSGHDGQGLGFSSGLELNPGSGCPWGDTAASCRALCACLRRGAELWILFTKMPSSLLLCSLQKFGFVPRCAGGETSLGLIQSWTQVQFSACPRICRGGERQFGWREKSSPGTQKYSVRERKKDSFYSRIFAFPRLVPSADFCRGF